MNYLRLQRLKAAEIEQPYVEGVEAPFERSEQRILTPAVWLCGHRKRKNSPTPNKRGGFKPAPSTVGKVGGKNPVNPPLEDSGNAEPPKRKLENEQIRCFQASLFAGKLRHKAIRLDGMLLLRLIFEIRRIGGIQEVRARTDRTESIGVEIRDDHIVPNPRE